MSEIFYVGLPPRNYPDFDIMAQRVLTGEILEHIGKFEALESLIPDIKNGP